MHPVFKPGVSLLWLDEETLRLGLGGGREPHYRLEPGLRRMLEAFDGTRDVPGLVDFAERQGVARDRALSLFERLSMDGALDDVRLAVPDLPRMDAAERARVGPQISALGLRHRLPGGGARALERRTQRQVTVYGLGPTGAQVACQLAAAGIGVVQPLDPGPVASSDTAPGTVGPAEVGRRREDAVARAIAQLNPSVRTVPPNRARPSDIAVVALDSHPADLVAELTAAQVPYLCARLVEDEALLGPLVLPGDTPCLHCADLQRAADEPHWPLLLAQLGASRPGEAPPHDGALCLLTAAYAVVQVLCLLDGGTPGLIGAELRLAPPDGLPDRRAVAGHPRCACGAAPGSVVGDDLLE